MAGILFTYLILAASQLNQLFVIDEIEFPRLAEAISETAKPVYYRGEEAPEHVGTFHPPLYAYLLGGWLFATGYDEITVRLFGVLLMLATAALGLRTLDFLGLRLPGLKTAFLAIFLLYPYTIQSALLPDIDGTVLLFASALLLHEIARRLTAPTVTTVRFVTGIGAIVALNLWAKLTSFPILAVLLVALLVTQPPGRAFMLAGLSVVIGIAGFLTTWAVVALVIGTPFGYPFEFTVQSGLKGGVGDAGIGELLSRIVPVDSTRYWIGWLLPTLLLWGIALAIRGWRASSESRLLVVYGMWAFGAYVMYSLLSGAPFGFPKYYIASIPAAAILAVVPLQDAASLLTRRRVALSIGLTIGLVAVASILWLGSPVGDATRYRAPGFLFWMGVVLSALLVVGGAIKNDRSERKAIWSLVAFSLVSVLIGFGIGLSWHQAYREDSVRYFPEEVGFAAVVERMNALLEPHEAFLAPKDVGSATTNRYFQEEVLFLMPEALVDRLEDSKVRYAVVRKTWDYSYLVFPEVEAVIEKYMNVQETIGDFIIYARVSGHDS